jgi:steroid delta-isomerase-like uncharacterized protein
MSSNVATLERNKTTVRSLLAEVINTGRPELCGRYLAPDRIDHQDYGMQPGAADGHEGFKRVLGGFIDAFPDLTLTIDFMVADGEKLVAYLTTTGTHLAPFMGAPATGRRFSVKGVDIFAFNDAGLISDHWGAFDTFGMMMQLGLIPAPQIQQAA